MQCCILNTASQIAADINSTYIYNNLSSSFYRCIDAAGLQFKGHIQMHSI